MARQFPSVAPVTAVFDQVSAIAPQPASFYEAGQFANVADKIVAEEFGRRIGWEPGQFDMVSTSGASLANMTAVLVARNRHLAASWKEGVGTGLRGRPAIAMGEDAHFSVSRIGGIIGIGEEQIIRLPLDAPRRICAKGAAAALDAAAARGLDVFCIVAAAGTTSVGADDPLEASATGGDQPGQSALARPDCGSGWQRPGGAFRRLPVVALTDKELSRIYYAEDRPGLVVPVERGGFQVATSGGTASGKPSEIVYPLDELWDTYAWAGAFLGRHVIAPHMPGDGAHWVATTLADHMMWSSSTMVGGVLQRILGINFIGAGAIDRHVFGRILAYPGDKAIVGTSRSIADLVGYADQLSPEERASFRLALYGSGEIQPRVCADLKAAYLNLSILSFFAAMQAETIGACNWMRTRPY